MTFTKTIGADGNTNVYLVSDDWGTVTFPINATFIRLNPDGQFELSSSVLPEPYIFKRAVVTSPTSSSDADLLAKLTDIFSEAIGSGGGGSGGATSAKQDEQITQIKGSNYSAEATVSIGNSSSVIVAANPNRKSLLINNTSGAVIYVNISGTTATTNSTRLANNESWHMTNADCPLNAVTGLRPSGTNSITIIEG